MNRSSSTIGLLLTPALALAFGGCTLVAPRLDRARMAAQEVAALSAIKSIQTAEVQYYSQFNRYAASLAELGPPANILPADLVAGKKNGYIFAVSPRANGYTVTAVPESFNHTGTRTFYTDESYTIHEHRGPQPATSQDPALQ